MQVKTIRAVGIALVTLVWAVLSLWAWFGPAKTESEAERRRLKQKPEFSKEAVQEGKFMDEFEEYTLDQFPMRDSFRQIKAIFHNYVMNYSDNNDLYIEKGYIVKQEYPLSEKSVAYAAECFDNVYKMMLRDNNCQVFLSVVPDKGYYLGEESGHLTPDYEAMIRQLQEGMSWATYIDITDTLSIEDYYRTDTHWRQEKLLPAAKRLCQAMGAKEPVDADYTVTAVDRPFYGVYYGQAALPVQPETLYYLYSEELSYCQVMDYEINKYTEVYNMNKLESKDLYDLYLSGPKGLLTIENPNAGNGKHLVIFRDSFGSSIAPLLVNGYSKVTLVDIRYMDPATVMRMIEGQDAILDFSNADVLFLYSTLVLNNSDTIKNLKVQEPMERVCGVWSAQYEVNNDQALQLLAEYKFHTEELALINTKLYSVKTITLNPDSTYSIGEKPEDVKACLEQYLRSVYEDLYAGREALRNVYEEDISLLSHDEFLQFYAELYGMENFDMLVQKKVEDVYDDAYLNAYETGSFTVNTKRLVMTAEGEQTGNEIPWSRTGDRLTLTLPEGEQTFNLVK